MALEQLLGALPRSVFLEEYYLRLPFSLPHGCRDLVHLGGWTTVEGLLSCPDADVLVGREGQRFEGERPRTRADARAVLAAGYTLGVRHADRHDAGLANLAAGFHADFRAPIDIHLYCTPAGQPGFGWHYDAEEVFILQTVGGKEWRLRKNTVNPWPLVETIPADMRYERELMPLLRCNLLAGDWLYIPAGYWHSTQAGAESISLSIGVAAPTALDVYDFLRPRLLESLRWRQRLPVAGAASPLGIPELVKQYQAICAELGHELAQMMGDEKLVRDFLRRDD